MTALRDQVVVITGVSSGLGRAIALELARHGNALVLAAPRTDALEDVAPACRDAGAHALVVTTDVTLESEVDQLVAAALDRFGRTDTWINNAGVRGYVDAGIGLALRRTERQLPELATSLGVLGTPHVQAFARQGSLRRS